MTSDQSDRERATAHVVLPAQTPRAIAVYAYRPQRSDDPHGASEIPGSLAAHGIGVVSVDFRPESPWDSASATGYEVSLLRTTVGEAREHGVPMVLIGHSAAGPLALAAAASLDDLSAVVTIGSPALPHPPVRSAVPLLILHAPADQVVSIREASRVFAAARHPKSFVALDGVDHAVSGPDNARRVAALIAAWLDPYLPATPAPSPGPAGEVVVTDAGTGTYTQRITAGRHVLTADEPSSVGGADAGPNPYDLLLAAVGACTSMTVRMYAIRKGLPLRRTTVRLRHDRVHAKDCAQDSHDTTLTRIHREIMLDGPLTEEDRQRLFEIADRCPVHRTLSTKTIIETTRAPAPGSGP
jgi:putative redox protein